MSASADSPWRELPFTVRESADGGAEVIVSVSAFSDFTLISSEPRLRTVPLHAGWNVVVWEGFDGAPIAEALGADALAQVAVIYQWAAETQSWRSFFPAAPPELNAFDTFAVGGSYWIAVAGAVDWTVAAGGSPTDP